MIFFKVLRFITLCCLSICLAGITGFTRLGETGMVWSCVLASIVCYRLYVYTKRKIASFFELRPTGNFALYLRSFKDDKTMGTSMAIAFVGGPLAIFFIPNYLRTKEENLAKIFERLDMKLFAVADPNRDLQYSGPAKYRLGADWFDNVQETLATAQKVVLMAAVTEGIKDEFCYILNNRRAFLSKTLIVLPKKKRTYSDILRILCAV
jgi:hypothetical protein